MRDLPTAALFSAAVQGFLRCGVGAVLRCPNGGACLACSGDGAVTAGATGCSAGGAVTAGACTVDGCAWHAWSAEPGLGPSSLRDPPVAASTFLTAPAQRYISLYSRKPAREFRNAVRSDAQAVGVTLAPAQLTALHALLFGDTQLLGEVQCEGEEGRRGGGGGCSLFVSPWAMRAYDMQSCLPTRAASHRCYARRWWQGPHPRAAYKTPQSETLTCPCRSWLLLRGWWHTAQARSDTGD